MSRPPIQGRKPVVGRDKPTTIFVPKYFGPIYFSYPRCPVAIMLRTVPPMTKN